MAQQPQPSLQPQPLLPQPQPPLLLPQPLLLLPQPPQQHTSRRMMMIHQQLLFPKHIYIHLAFCYSRVPTKGRPRGRCFVGRLVYTVSYAPGREKVPGGRQEADAQQVKQD